MIISACHNLNFNELYLCICAAEGFRMAMPSFSILMARNYLMIGVNIFAVMEFFKILTLETWSL